MVFLTKLNQFSIYQSRFGTEATYNVHVCHVKVEGERAHLTPKFLLYMNFDV